MIYPHGLYSPQGLFLVLRPIWDFPKIGVPYFGVLTIRILLFIGYYIRVPLLSETPIYKPFAHRKAHFRTTATLQSMMLRVPARAGRGGPSSAQLG